MAAAAIQPFTCGAGGHGRRLGGCTGDPTFMAPSPALQTPPQPPVRLWGVPGSQGSVVGAGKVSEKCPPVLNRGRSSLRFPPAPPPRRSHASTHAAARCTQPGGWHTLCPPHCHPPRRAGDPPDTGVPLRCVFLVPDLYPSYTRHAPSIPAPSLRCATHTCSAPVPEHPAPPLHHSNTLHPLCIPRAPCTPFAPPKHPAPHVHPLSTLHPLCTLLPSLHQLLHPAQQPSCRHGALQPLVLLSDKRGVTRSIEWEPPPRDIPDPTTEPGREGGWSQGLGVLHTHGCRGQGFGCPPGSGRQVLGGSCQPFPALSHRLHSQRKPLCFLAPSAG